MKTLNLIEPTLFDQTGHSYGYVQSLINANGSIGFNLRVWLDKRGKTLLQNAACESHGYFYRATRQIQKLILYFKLIKRDEIIFISTGELWDLQILAFYLKHLKTRAKIVLHFHQFKQNKSKIKALQKIKSDISNVKILAPTQQLADFFHNQGLTQSAVMPCPVFSAPRNVPNLSAKFNKLLYAGAARSDKGFPIIVKLLQYLRSNNNDIPFEIQVSTPNSQRYDHDTQQALQLLQSLPNNNLILHDSTLDQSQYLNLFNNSICLLLYDQKHYHDKFSGVALDAFYSGSPIITINNTWMGDTVQHYQAGIALDNYSYAHMQQAIETIVNNYEFYQNNAKRAAVDLSSKHDPKNTLLYISNHCC
jgi:glycosyltransferase involved in cell wall biosynthesis